MVTETVVVSVVVINVETKAKQTRDGLEKTGVQDIGAIQTLRMNGTMSFARKR